MTHNKRNPPVAAGGREDRHAGGDRSTAIMPRTPRLPPGDGRTLRAVPDNAMAGEVTALRAETQIAALHITEWPEYGTPDWLSLDPKDPRYYAATLEAAELHRRRVAEERRLDLLMDEDPDAWFAEVTADANAEAARIAPALARMRTNAEREREWNGMFERAARDWADRRARIDATTWPPVTVPGQPSSKTGASK
jgi:hypothetical protein